MKLKTFDAPHIRHHENARTLMTDALLAMLFLYGIAFFYHGPRVVALGLTSVICAVVCDFVCNRFAMRKVNLRDLSPLVTGMLLPLLMPASIEYSVVITAVIFGIVVAKHPFGGMGHNVFNPAAAGFSFAAICFSDRMFLYPLPLNWLPVTGAVETTMVNAPAFTLSLGGIPNYDLVDILLGNYPGPMGATNILVILACLLYLVLRGTVNWRIPLCFFSTVALIALLFPRVGTELVGMGMAVRARMMMYELTSGFLLLGGAFLLGDPVTTPKRDIAKVAFAIASGLIVMLFRLYGGMEEAFTFALLVMNAAVWGFDMLGEKLVSLLRHRTPKEERRSRS